MKKKVLFIMHMPPPVHGAAMMGQYIHDSEIINRDFECRYINPSASRVVAEVGKVSIRKIFFLVSHIMSVVYTIITFRPDLCYYTPTSSGWGVFRDMMMILLLKLFKRKIILHLHNKGVSECSGNMLYNFAYKRMFSGVKVILLAKELYPDVDKYVSKKNLYICPNGIPSSNHQYKKRNSIHNPYTFLFLSNMIETKGVLDVIRACGMLKKHGLIFKCNFVGRWSTVTAERFNQVADQNDVSMQVEYKGPKYGNEKTEELKYADALVFPTYYPGETFGLVLLEAMEYGLPCISSIVGGIPTVVDNGVTGFLIEPMEVEKLADKMKWLIQNPEIGMDMGDMGHKRFEEKFTLQIFEQNLASILSDACKC